MDNKEIIVYNRNLPEQVQERMNPELLKLILLDDLAVSARKIQRQFEKEAFEGEVDPRTLECTAERQAMDLIFNFPHTPWITASFFNDGPDTAYISINHVVTPIELEDGESTSVDFSKADKRIGLIFYWCASGETASVRVVGKY